MTVEIRKGMALVGGFLLAVGVIGTQAVDTLRAQDRRRDADVERINAATTALVDIMSMGEKGIPRAILEKAEGIVFFPRQERIPRRRGQGPNTLKTARLLDIDARGLFSIRGDNGTWSVPAFLTLAGSSPLPVEADLVLVIVSRRGVENVKGFQFDVGAGATVAPGPVTGDTQSWTDQQHGADIHAYSRAGGALTGLSLSAGILQGDMIAHQRFYGKQLTTAGAIAQTSGREPVPAWQEALAKHTSR